MSPEKNVRIKSQRFAASPKDETSVQRETTSDVDKSDNSSTLPVIEGFDLIRVVGQGGMGIVFEAVDETLQRPVAIKTLPFALVTEDIIERLEQEAKMQAILDHPHIVRLLGYGSTKQNNREVPYLVMEFVDGGNLQNHVESSKLTFFQIAELLAKLAGALSLCHSRGVIHRDLKPGNVLISTSGEPKLTDFGLGKLFEENSRITKTGNIMGTPAYMSPEQASGAVKNIGPSADIYALGVILYELLCGVPPFDAPDPIQSVVKTLTCAPSSLRSRNSGIPLELDAIALKCLEKKPNHRYSTAAELEQDLKRYLQHQPILAKPTPTRRRVWLWVRRNPMLTSIALFFVFAVFAASVGIGVHVRQLNDEIRRSKRLIEHGRTLSHWLLDEFSNDLHSPEGTTFISNQLADRTQSYLDNLSEEAPGDVELIRELAFAFSRLAGIQGMADGSSLGQTSRALDNLAKAERLVEILVEKRVKGIERIQIDIAMQKTAHAIRGEDYRTARENIASIQRLLDNFAHIDRARKLAIELEIYVNQFELGFVDGDANEMQRCLAMLKQIKTTLTEEFPEEQELIMLAIVYISNSQERLYDAANESQRLTELLVESRSAIDQLVAKHPSQRGVSFLANIDKKLGDTFFRKSEFSTALKHYRSALKIWCDFEKRDRLNTVVLKNVALINQDLGECLVAMNQLEEAAIAMDESEHAFQNWLQNSEFKPGETKEFLFFLGARSRLSVLSGDVAMAREQNDRKLAGFRKMKTSAPNRRAIGDALVFRTLIEIVETEQSIANGLLKTDEERSKRLKYVRECQAEARDHFESMKSDNLASGPIDSQLKLLDSLDKTLESWETRSKDQ